MDIVAHPSEKPPISLALMGISLVEARALGLDHDVPLAEVREALESMHLYDLQQFARACGLPARGNWQTVLKCLMAFYEANYAGPAG